MHRERHSKHLWALLEHGKFALVKGTGGSGKTTLVHQLAEERNLTLHTIQLNDQLDSKFLQEECVILLEDLDAASPDLVAEVFNLAERREYALPNGSGSTLHVGCRIVATVKSDKDKTEMNTLLRSCPFVVELPSFTEEEMETMISVKYPQASAAKKTILEIFKSVASSINVLPSSERRLTPTDLFRACARLERLPDLSDNTQVFHELSDCWILHLTRAETQLEMALLIGGPLSISAEHVKYLMRLRMPEVSQKEDCVQFGRSTLRRQDQAQSRKTRAYGLTKDYCQLMERTAKCISSDEPVLLTGETGVGKTTVLSMMALYTNTRLQVVNLSQDSDTSDLIGGYKPVAMINMLKPLANDYSQLFTRCFDKEKNSKFFEHLNSCLSSGRFADYLRLVVETGVRAINLKKEPTEWARLIVRAQRLLKSLSGRGSALPFAYVRGVVAEAAELGHWLLVDEINLASAECLNAILNVLDGSMPRHANFRLFACMNPATDAGKQKLPVGVRSKFTEFFVNEPSEPEQLSVIVKNYLPAISATHLQLIVQFYTEILVLLPRKFSLRNLCRAAVFACDNIYGNSFRSLYEGLVIAFTSNLDNDSRQKVLALVERYFGKAPKDKAVLPSEKRDRFIEIEGVFIEKGHTRIEEDPEYVYTPSISSNLARVAAAVASGRFPVLLEGETSAGKTSMIVHLAKITGNRVFRINNHEHTDIQEYIGGYAPDENGKLTFIEGVLLKAVKNGDWIILDELNLAAAEVLEALNRLLDDNRELFVAELNLTVTAHRQFRLFATQNPVGSYAGRKRLSRAFLNRFLVLHFDPPPFSELSQIVEKRCAVPPSASKKMIDVLAELKSRRAISGIFAATDGLMTLRDLFRWGNRLRTSQNGDWQQVLADQGYFLLGTRCRNKQDEVTVIEVLEKVLKRRIEPEKLFAADSHYLPGDLDPGRVVMTLDMRRMLVLCSEAWKCDEPVLFVGETGCGKTTAAHLLSKGRLLSINCHERTETSDLLGSIRPLSDGTFQWQDGVIVQAMKTGEKILIDEISLAADSVLERLNPILESGRTVLLTDAGAGSDTVKAAAGFQVVATMNPGGDHGKKELSKALRNRFTEVWCTAHYENQDVEAVICNRLRKETRIEPQQCAAVATAFRHFFTYFAGTFGALFRSSLSMRDVVMMTESFISCHNNLRIPVAESIYHAIAANLFDAFELLPSRVTFDSTEVTRTCLKELHDIFKDVGLLADASTADCSSYSSAYYMLVTPAHTGLCVGPFRIPRGPLPPSELSHLQSRSCWKEALERAKSSLVVALAAVTGNRLVRLNLSDQTDLSDLFGSDVPVITTDGRTSFAWKDGPVLRAIKNGYWVLLDEMNLASQSVLEGLNSCFDFRKKLFIAELNKTFEIESTTCRFFACQNPQKQGGDRRALPKSFLNRFTSIAVNEMTNEDFVFVLEKALRGRFDKDIIHNMVEVNKRVADSHIREGGPFEFNLRDLLRWSEAAVRFDDLSLAYELTYVSRCRTKDERGKVREIYKTILSEEAWCPPVPLIDKADGCLCFGPVQLRLLSERRAAARSDIRFLASQASVLQKLAACASMNWLALLVGPCHVGKRSTLEGLATAVGARLKTLRLTPETDALELLGTYEQVTDIVEFRRYQKELITTLNTSNDLTESKSLSSEARACESALDLCILAQQALQLATEDETRKRLESIVHVLSNNSIRFEWIDSPFVQAYLQGDWILIQDVNCCSAAVLDRLNTCLEKDGELVVPERTQDQTTPLPRHPDFRVFFSMDPRNGPLSRAMRNRSVEIFMGDEESWNKNAVDSLSIVLGPNNAVLDVVSEEDQQELLGAVEGLGAKEKLQLNSLAPSKDASEWMTRVKRYNDGTFPDDPSRATPDAGQRLL
ncbi:midasin [Aphelenchoides avenae]|nr:midasin [Aphelenchus avenae]